MGNGISGQVSDIEIHAKEMLNTKKKLTDIYVKHTGVDFDKLTNAMDRDDTLSPGEAKDEFGLLDNVVEQKAVQTREVLNE